ncbi:MAG: hypothetical protein A3J38_08080 [Gammaproteobacteria bacterium RIFCSPHIGHO2_12_FULL_45_9]|nr:MAG: hypothetical protein A3J38_08080 [Gammaproteobacteria bacterium RIFCSPHIGHO2_12_FULL_45_9]
MLQDALPVNTIWKLLHPFFTLQFFTTLPPESPSPDRTHNMPLYTGAIQHAPTSLPALKAWIWSDISEKPTEKTPITPEFEAFRAQFNELFHLLTLIYQQRIGDKLPLPPPLTHDDYMITRQDFQRNLAALQSNSKRFLNQFLNAPYTASLDILHLLYTNAKPLLESIVAGLRGTHVPDAEAERIILILSDGLAYCAGRVHHEISTAKSIIDQWIDVNRDLNHRLQYHRQQLITNITTHAIPANAVESGYHVHYVTGVLNVCRQTYGLPVDPDPLTQPIAKLAPFLPPLRMALQEGFTTLPMIEALLSQAYQTMITILPSLTAHTIAADIEGITHCLNTLGPDTTFKIGDLLLITADNHYQLAPSAKPILLRSIIQRLITTGYLKPTSWKQCPIRYFYSETTETPLQVQASKPATEPPNLITLSIETGPYPTTTLVCATYRDPETQFLTETQGTLNAFLFNIPMPLWSPTHQQLLCSLLLADPDFSTCWNNELPAGPYLAILSDARSLYPIHTIDSILLTALQHSQWHTSWYIHNLIQATLENECAYSLQHILQHATSALQSLLPVPRRALISNILSREIHYATILTLFSGQLEALCHTVSLSVLLECLFLPTREPIRLQQTAAFLQQLRHMGVIYQIQHHIYATHDSLLLCILQQIHHLLGPTARLTHDITSPIPPPLQAQILRYSIALPIDTLLQALPLLALLTPTAITVILQPLNIHARWMRLLNHALATPENIHQLCHHFVENVCPPFLLHALLEQANFSFHTFFSVLLSRPGQENEPTILQYLLVHPDTTQDTRNRMTEYQIRWRTLYSASRHRFPFSITVPSPAHLIESPRKRTRTIDDRHPSPTAFLNDSPLNEADTDLPFSSIRSP